MKLDLVTLSIFLSHNLAPLNFLTEFGGITMLYIYEYIYIFTRLLYNIYLYIYNIYYFCHIIPPNALSFTPSTYTNSSSNSPPFAIMTNKFF
jgi:hypothetical protein